MLSDLTGHILLILAAGGATVMNFLIRSSTSEQVSNGETTSTGKSGGKPESLTLLDSLACG